MLREAASRLVQKGKIILVLLRWTPFLLRNFKRRIPDLRALLLLHTILCKHALVHEQIRTHSFSLPPVDILSRTQL
jgi:hypothetical protein